MSKGDGGLAFPRPASIMGNGQFAWDQEGMSVRQWFAGMAMMGSLANPSIDMKFADVAKTAYEQADAMLGEEAK